MIVTKILETTVDIMDPNDVYSKSIDQTILDILTKKYKNICYKSCYILEIIRIVQRSLIKINSLHNSSMYVDVLFEVKCVIFFKGEILGSVTIINKEQNGKVQCKHEYCSIELDSDDVLNLFKEGDQIPIISLTTRYICGNKSISMLARILQPIPKEEQWFLCNNIPSKDDISKLKILFDEANVNSLNLGDIKSNKKDDQNYNKDIYKFFSNLLYTFKKKKAFEKEKMFDEIKVDYDSILKISKFDNCLIYKPLELEGYDTIFFTKDINPKELAVISGKHTIQEEKFMSIIQRFILDKIIYDLSIKSLLQSYKTKEDIKRHEDIFDFYHTSKKD